ncbi:hypothetical protein Cflav_PD6450 [Pedosphaera parvula Ellin514]|uniref:Uncharacterized protein n=1 Tax=Pedosphaera parvula (strain Ellin514) TaxID=320771 RepID=B9XDM9_PEDPL|nr:hypothetical protein Cflav_PD6450 [Pedosphaera parvula Ellin514]
MRLSHAKTLGTFYNLQIDRLASRIINPLSLTIWRQVAQPQTRKTCAKNSALLGHKRKCGWQGNDYLP